MMREDIRQFLKLKHETIAPVYEVHETVEFEGFVRQRITYAAADGDSIPAFLYVPEGEGEFPAVQIHHQHAGQRHTGKSEVAGLIGDSNQAFAPVLAAQGFVVLAADSICFEERRKHATGTDKHEDDDLQHYREMGERLTLGDTLMRKVLSDASVGLSVLAHHPQVNPEKIGIMGHSYGGNTVLFQAALDTRIQWAVSSGALCSYRYKREHDIALEMALIIPGFAARWDMETLLDCIVPRPVFILSAAEDPFSMDAADVIARATTSGHITHFHDEGGHALTPERFKRIVDFVISVSG